MFRLIFLLAVLAAMALSPAAANAPQAYQAKYEVLRNGSVLGMAEVNVAQSSPGIWTMRSETRGTRGVAAMAGVEVSERSRFRWEPQTLEAVEYDYRQRAAMRTRERSVRVDAKAGSIRTSDRGDETRLDYRSGVLDRQILPLAIARDVAKGGATSWTYLVADRGDLSEHVYRRVGTERISAPSGEVDAVRIERVRAGSDRETTLWLDPARGYLPVRVIQNEGRDRVETRLVEHR